jgi:hypothetical protein
MSEVAGKLNVCRQTGLNVRADDASSSAKGCRTALPKGLSCNVPDASLTLGPQSQCDDSPHDLATPGPQSKGLLVCQYEARIQKLEAAVKALEDQKTVIVTQLSEMLDIYNCQQRELDEAAKQQAGLKVITHEQG